MNKRYLKYLTNMPSCVVPTCHNQSTTTAINKKQRITFHRFPIDEVRRDIWTKIIQSARLDKNWKPSKVSVICSSHFKEEHILYSTDNGLKRLSPEAYPSQYMVCNADLVQGIKTTAEQHKPSKAVPKEKKMSIKNNNRKPKAMDKTSQLKSDLHHLSIFYKNYTRKIKAMHQKNSRLSVVIEGYECTLRNLKNKEINKEVLSDLAMRGILKSTDIKKIKLKILQTVKQTKTKKIKMQALS